MYEVIQRWTPVQGQPSDIFSFEDFPAVERFIDRKESGELRPPEKVAADIFAISEQSNIENGRRYDAAG